MTQLSYNFILDADSYKLSHPGLWRKNITAAMAYIEPRIKGETIVPVGLQMYILKVLSKPITKQMVDEAEAFAVLHGEPFDRSDWDYIIDVYDGFIPITIRAVPEGTPVPSGNVIVTIECDDPRVVWLVAYVETGMQRTVWYPTTIASNDFAIKQNLIRIYETTGADKGLLPFALHDFGGRGVSSEESAQIGGMAHLVNFMGSDNISGVRAANLYYSSSMSAYSVPATEHTIQLMYGASKEEQLQYLRDVIGRYGKKGGIVSIVIDGFDTFREATSLCVDLHDFIVETEAKVVFRPDSGDPLEIVPKLLKMQADAFGYDINEKGYKKVRTVGIIQGDGVDSLLIDMMLNKIANMGYAADNVIFGSGGALLQKVNRDTYKFAQKVCALCVDGEWIGVSKDPVTDPGKRSKAGRLTLARSSITGEYKTVERYSPGSEWEDVMRVVYHKGQVLNTQTLDQVRSNTGLWG